MKNFFRLFRVLDSIEFQPNVAPTPMFKNKRWGWEKCPGDKGHVGFIFAGPVVVVYVTRGWKLSVKDEKHPTRFDENKGMFSPPAWKWVQPEEWKAVHGFIRDVRTRNCPILSGV